jgi:hypothetical protein
MPDWIQPALLTLNSLAVVGSAWTATLATRRADRLERVARGVLADRRSETTKTRVMPLKRTTPGQRLRAALERR